MTMGPTELADILTERSEKRDQSPCDRVVAGLLCETCNGSGLDRALTTFEVDAHNPQGYWDEHVCTSCQGSGAHAGVDQTREDLQTAERCLRDQQVLIRKVNLALSDLHRRVAAAIASDDPPDPWDLLQFVEGVLEETVDLINPKEGTT